MYGMTRGFMTLLGVAGAGVLVWLATWMRDDDRGEYWAAAGLYAAAGLALALSQLLGGWTKWGWPRVSPEVLVLGFVPALVLGGWAIGAHEPSGWFADNLGDWADDAGVGGFVDDLAEAVPALALGIGLVFGFTFDTSGPALPRRETPERDPLPEPRPVDDEIPATEPRNREPVP
jgi:hypothetical protein